MKGLITEVFLDGRSCWIRTPEKKYWAHFTEFAHPLFIVPNSEVEFTPAPAIKEGQSDRAIQVVVKKLYRKSEAA